MAMTMVPGNFSNSVEMSSTIHPTIFSAIILPPAGWLYEWIDRRTRKMLCMAGMAGMGMDLTADILRVSQSVGLKLLLCLFRWLASTRRQRFVAPETVLVSLVVWRTIIWILIHAICRPIFHFLGLGCIKDTARRLIMNSIYWLQD